MKPNNIVPVITFGFVSVFSFAVSAEDIKEPAPSDWQFILSGGMGVAPDYEGSNDYDVGFAPNVEVIWKEQVSLSLDGLYIDALQTENLRFGLGVGMGQGRNESENVALKGLGKIDTSVEGVLYGAYSFDAFEVSARFAQDLGDGHEGATIGLEANAFLPVTERLMFSVGPDVTWASKNYMQSFFGVNSKQAAASGYSAFNAGSGFKDIGLHVASEYQLTESISISAVAQYKKLLGDAADSPFVKHKGSDNQLFGGLSLTYSF